MGNCTYNPLDVDPAFNPLDVDPAEFEDEDLYGTSDNSGDGCCGCMFLLFIGVVIVLFFWMM